MNNIVTEFDEIYWERLCSAIRLGYVVPVIGANAIFTEKEKTISQTIFERFCKILNISSSTILSDYDDYLYLYDDIQSIHSNYKAALEDVCGEEDIKTRIVGNSKELIDFLSLKNFPVIIYCSVTTQVCQYHN